MKKHFFTALLVIVIVLISSILSACNSYRSHYNAVAFVHTNTHENAYMSFSSFEGTMVFRLKCKSADKKISYSAKLDKGSAKVYYDCNGTKFELFSVNSDEDISGIGGELQKGTVYIIVQTSERSKNGRFNFEIK